jgi:hypothetical protein
VKVTADLTCRGYLTRLQWVDRRHRRGGFGRNGSTAAYAFNVPGRLLVYLTDSGADEVRAALGDAGPFGYTAFGTSFFAFYPIVGRVT